MYAININPGPQLVHVTLAGMMSVEEVGAYIVELKRGFVANRLREWALLLDIRDCPIQQQVMVQAMGEHMATMPKARAIGVVVGSSLARMQARRLFSQPYARLTFSLREARAWVLDGVEPQAD